MADGSWCITLTRCVVGTYKNGSEGVRVCSATVTSLEALLVLSDIMLLVLISFAFSWFSNSHTDNNKHSVAS